MRRWLRKIRDRALRMKSDLIGPLRPVFTGSDIQPKPFDYASHAKVFLVDVWAYACIRAIAEAISSVPLRAMQQVTRDAEPVYEPMESGPLVELLARPNAQTPLSQLISEWVVNLLSTGNGYLTYDENDNEIHTAQTSWVDIRADKLGRIVGYNFSRNAATIRLDPDAVVHAKLINPTGEYYGLPPSEVIKKTILMKLEMTGYIHSYFQNDALPGSTFSTEQTLTPQQRKTLRQEFDRLHRGYDQAFKVAILERGTKLDRLAHSLKDLIPAELYKVVREETLAAYGVPHVIVGVMDDASFANAFIQTQVFWQTRALPYINHLEDMLNLQLTPRFGERIKLEFDTSDVPALQEDAKLKTDRVTKLKLARIITPNEARKEYGLPPIEGGDEMGPDLTSLLAGGAGVSTPASDADGNNDSQRSNTIVVYDRSRVVRARSDSGQAYYQFVKQREREMELLMRSFFDEQIDRVLKDLHLLGEKDRFNSALLFARLHRKADEIDVDTVFSVPGENKRLLVKINPLVLRETIEAGNEGINVVGGSGGFNVAAPEVSEALSLARNRIVKVNDTTYLRIKQILGNAYDDGWGIDKTARTIRNDYKSFAPARAKTIAKTEMNGIVNGGHYLGYEQGGAVEKAWLSARLPTSRESHMAVEDQGRIPIKNSFDVGGSSMLYPSDPNGAAEDVINCYCSVVAF